MMGVSSEESSLGNDGDLPSTALPESTTQKVSGKATSKKQKRGALSVLLYKSNSMQYS